MVQIIIIVLLVAADQLTKFLIWAPIPLLNETVPVIPGVLNYTKIANEGASFGMLQGAQWFFIIMTVVVLIGAGYFMIRYRHKQSRYVRIIIAVVFAGALGNLIDRIAFGYVRDFIDFRVFDFWNYVFNVADAALVIGAILLCVYLLFFHKDKKALVDSGEKSKDSKDETAKPDSGGETSE
jgi:signal peptidase II